MGQRNCWRDIHLGAVPIAVRFAMPDKYSRGVAQVPVTSLAIDTRVIGMPEAISAPHVNVSW